MVPEPPTPVNQYIPGEKARFLAIIDNGAIINAIDTAAYQRIM
jgi:hypothetical protein